MLILTKSFYLFFIQLLFSNKNLIKVKKMKVFILIMSGFLLVNNQYVFAQNNINIFDSFNSAHVAKNYAYLDLDCLSCNNTNLTYSLNHDSSYNLYNPNDRLNYASMATSMPFISLLVGPSISMPRFFLLSSVSVISIMAIGYGLNVLPSLQSNRYFNAINKSILDINSDQHQVPMGTLSSLDTITTNQIQHKTQNHKLLPPDPQQNPHDYHVLFPDPLIHHQNEFKQLNGYENADTIELNNFFYHLHELISEVNKRLRLMDQGFKNLSNNSQLASDLLAEIDNYHSDILLRFFHKDEKIYRSQLDSMVGLESFGIKLHNLAQPIEKFEKKLSYFHQHYDFNFIDPGLSHDNLSKLHTQLYILGGSFAGLKGRLKAVIPQIKDIKKRKAIIHFVNGKLAFDSVLDKSSKYANLSEKYLKISGLSLLLDKISLKVSNLSDEFSNSDLLVQVGYPSIERYNHSNLRMELALSLLWLNIKFFETELEQRELLEAEIKDLSILDQQDFDYPWQSDALIRNINESKDDNFSVDKAISLYLESADLEYKLADIYKSSYAHSLIKLKILLNKLKDKLNLDQETMNDHIVLWDKLFPSARRHLVFNFSRRSKENATFVQRASAEILKSSVILEIIKQRSYREGIVFGLLAKKGMVDFYKFDRLFYELSLPHKFKKVPLGTVVQSKQQKLAQMLQKKDQDYQQIMKDKLNNAEFLSWQKAFDIKQVANHKAQYKLSLSSRIFVSALPHLDELISTLKSLLQDY